MNAPTLGIRWLSGRLEAVLVGGSEPSRWTAPGEVTSPGQLAEVLSEARRALDPRVRSAVLVFEHRDLHLGVEETPRARGRTLDRLLDRVVAERCLFEEKAVWSRSKLPGSDRNERWLLAVLPERVLQEIEDAFVEAGLDLAGAYPVASVIPRLPGVGSTASAYVAVVVDLGVGHALWVGREDGVTLFARYMAASGGVDFQRLEQEVHRTLGFARQRLGAVVTRLRLGGGGLDVALGRPLRESGLRVEGLEPAWDPAAFPVHVARMGAGCPLNLIQHSGRVQPWQRRALAMAALVFLGIALLVSAGIEWRVRRHGAEIGRAHERVRTAERVAAAAEARTREARQLATLVACAGQPGARELAPVLVRYLREIVPADSRFTSLHLRRATNGWDLRIEGATRQPGSRFPALVQALDEELSGGPLGLQVIDSTHRRSFAGVGDGAERPLDAAPRTAPAEERAFFVSGLIP